MDSESRPGEGRQGRVAGMVGPGLLYAGTLAAQRAVAFALLPVFTRVLAPSEYGELSIALSINSVAVVVLTFGLELAVFRTTVHLAGDPENRERFVGSVWTFLLVAPLVVALAATAIFSPAFASTNVITVPQLALAMLAAALYVGATTVPLALLRVDKRLRDFAIISAVGTATSVGFQLITVVVLGLGVSGWLVSLCVGWIVTLVVAMRIVPFRRPRPFDRELVRRTLAQSIPVIPHFAAMWSLQLADRLLLAALVSTAAVGVYSLASNMATPLFVILIGLNQAVMPSYAQAGTSAEPGRLQSLVRWQVAAVAVLSMFWALAAPPAINLFLASKYEAAAGLTPWIVLGYALVGLYAIPMNGVTLTHGRPKRVWIVSLSAAIVNLGLIYVLVPNHGLEAAAIASAIGYAALLGGVVLFARLTSTDLRYPWKSLGAILLTCLVAYAICSDTVGERSYMDLVIRCGWSLVAAVSVLAMVSGRRLRQVIGDRL